MTWVWFRVEGFRIWAGTEVFQAWRFPAVGKEIVQVLRSELDVPIPRLTS